MGFKLGTVKKPYAVNVNVKVKLRFGKEAGDEASVPGTPVIRKPLAEGILGEANMDGSIYISDKIKPGSFEERQVLMHEMIHQKDMKLGKLAYADDHIKWNGETFERKTIKGKDMIMYEGEWTEAGHDHFPWEKMPWGH